MMKYYDYFYLYYHWHEVFYFAWRKIHYRCFLFVPGCNFSDAQLMHALGPVIYIQLEGLMNGKAMHVMRF